MIEPWYYIRRSRRFLSLHRLMAGLYRAELTRLFGTDGWQEIAAGAEAGFLTQLGQVPYIGGDANPFTRVLVQAASLLSLWRCLEPRGITVDEFGRLTNQVLPAYLERYPRLLRRWLGTLYLSRPGRRRMERNALRSQDRQYPEDFVYTVVEGDGRTFAWGVDYHECGLVKFLRSQGAEALAPYLCALDDAVFPALGIDLQRTGTIAQGSTRCDFRFAPGHHATQERM